MYVAIPLHTNKLYFPFLISKLKKKFQQSINTAAKSGKLDKRTKLTDLWHDLFRVNKCTFATYIFTTFKKLYTIYTETFDKLLYSEYLQCKIIFLNCSATKHDPITQKYHHYCFLDPWKFASCKSTHLGWNIIFKLQSKQYNNHLHYVWIMHYITYEHEY